MKAFICEASTGCKTKSCGHSVPHLELAHSPCINPSFCDLVKKPVKCVEKEFDDKEVSKKAE